MFLPVLILGAALDKTRLDVMQGAVCLHHASLRLRIIAVAVAVLASADAACALAMLHAKFPGHAIPAHALTLARLVVVTITLLAILDALVAYVAPHFHLPKPPHKPGDAR